MTANRYPIATVADFAKIPRDRLKVCLQEFAVAIEAAAITVDLLHAIQDEVAPEEPKIEWPLTNFVWIDDDKRELAIHVGPAEPTTSDQAKEG